MSNNIIFNLFFFLRKVYHLRGQHTEGNANWIAKIGGSFSANQIKQVQGTVIGIQVYTHRTNAIHI